MMVTLDLSPWVATVIVLLVAYVVWIATDTERRL